MMEPPSYMWSVVDRNIVMRHIPVCMTIFLKMNPLVRNM